VKSGWQTVLSAVESYNLVPWKNPETAAIFCGIFKMPWMKEQLWFLANGVYWSSK